MLAVARRVTAGFFLILVSVPFGSLAQAHEKRTVENCPGDTEGTFVVHSPLPGQSFAQGPVPLRVRARCGEVEFGDVPFIIQVDGIGYCPAKGFAHEYTPGQLFAPGRFPKFPCQTGGHGLLRYRLQVPPGTHTLRIGSGYQGTDLPRFDPIEFSLTVRGELPRTGFPLGIWTAAAILMIMCGLGLTLTNHRNVKAGRTSDGIVSDLAVTTRLNSGSGNRVLGRQRPGCEAAPGHAPP